MLETLLKPDDIQERCGFVLKRNKIVEVRNIAFDPVKGYEMDPKEALTHLTSGNVKGTWHTHPDQSPQFSGDDYRGFLGWPDLKHYIVGVEEGETVVKCYEIKDGAIFECA